MKRFHPSFCLFLIACFSAAVLSGQETEQPKYGGSRNIVGSLSITQVNFANWTQGGEDAFAWQIVLDNKFVNDQARYNWTTTGKFSFGKTKLGDSGFRKSIDEIKLESVLTYKLGSTANPYVAATALTQFARGFQYGDENSRVQVSEFLDPGYFTQSIGFGVQPHKSFKIRAGFSLKETVTSDFPVPYADDPATPEIEKTRTEAGMESVTDFSRSLSANTLLTTKLELFSNLAGLEEVDVNWDSTLAAKVSKVISVNFNVRLLYDRNISRKRQLKQALALGLTYTIL